MTGGSWRVVQLGDVLERIKRPVRLHDDELYRTLGVRWYGAGCFLKAEQRGADIAAKTLYGIEAGDVIFSRLFAWKGSFGIARSVHHGVVASNEFPTFRASDDLLPEYFALWSSRSAVWEEADALSTGTAANSRNRLAEEAFCGMEIELPPIEEQRAILRSVERASQARSAYETEMAALERLRVTALDALLSDPDQQQVKLVDLLTDLRTGTSPRCETRPPADGEWGVLKLSAIRPGQFSGAEAKALPAGTPPVMTAAVQRGDVFMTRSNTLERVGAVCRVHEEPDKLLFPDLVFRLTLDESLIDPDFAVFALSSRAAREQIEMGATGTSDSMKKISARVIKALQLPLPSLTKQREVARQLLEITRAIDGADRASHTLAQLENVLKEDLVTGERRAPDLENLSSREVHSAVLS